MASGRLLAITGGHRFDAGAFTALLDAICAGDNWTWQHATQPEAQHLLRAELADECDAILLHDLPGLALQRGAEPVPCNPSEAVQRGIAGLLDAGVGIVATHHALAGWPAWEAWAEVLGGRFLYAPGHVRGVEWPASGYRIGTYRVSPTETTHPVYAGIEAFEVIDELYLCPVFEGDVVPLLSTDADLTPDTMIDTYHEVRHGEQVPAHTMAGGATASRLVGWANAAGRSPIVYVLPGHTGATMAHPTYRRLMSNAVRWVASPEARVWATRRAGGAPFRRRS